MIRHIALTLAFFASILFLPWYVPVMLGVLLIAFYQAYLFAIIGGIVLDSMFGTSIISLYSVSFLYTILFATLSILSALLRRYMME